MNVSTKSQEKFQPTTFLADSRFERLLTIGKEMNDLRAKIGVATAYMMDRKGSGEAEDVEYAREELVRDLKRDSEEAGELMPVIDEIISKFQEQIRFIDKRRKLNRGLAHIEGMTGADDRSQEFQKVAVAEGAQVSELENLIYALDSFGRDLSSRSTHVISCPRCSSKNISYRLTPSDLGFTLYKCGVCSNAWKITEFSLKVG